MTWTSFESRDRLLLVDGTWLRESAVEAFEVGPKEGSTLVYLKSGQVLRLNVSVDDVIKVFRMPYPDGK